MIKEVQFEISLDGKIHTGQWTYHQAQTLEDLLDDIKREIENAVEDEE